MVEHIDPSTILGRAVVTATQFVYVTNDTAAAEASLTAVGIGPWVSVEGPDHGATTVRARFAFHAGRMIEVVETLDEPMIGAEDDPLIAVERVVFPKVKGDGLSLAFHAMGAFIDVDRADLERELTGLGLTFMTLTRDVGDIVFVDTRELLGHWVKVLCFSRQRRAAATD